MTLYPVTFYAVREPLTPGELGELADALWVFDGRCAIVRSPSGDHEGSAPVRVASGILVRRANTGERRALWWVGPHPGTLVSLSYHGE